MEDQEQAGNSVAAEPRASVEGLFIELGQQRSQDVACLKEGTGAMIGEINAAIDRWRANLGIGTAGDIVPVVLLYRARNLRVPDDSQ